MFPYTEQSDHVVPCIDAIVLNENDEVLLMHRIAPPEDGKWSIIGGRVEMTDHNLEHTVQREVEEETGLQVAVEDLVTVLSDPDTAVPADPRFYVVQTVFTCRVTGGSFRVSDEGDQFEWVSLADALTRSLSFNHQEILHIYQQKKRDGTVKSAKRRCLTEYYEKGYTYLQNNEFPRFAGNALILNKQNHILLGKRAKKPGVGDWDIIGGHMKLGETIQECVIREVKEELGVNATVGELFGVYSDQGRNPRSFTAVACYFTTIDSEDFQKILRYMISNIFHLMHCHQILCIIMNSFYLTYKTI